MNPLNPFSTRFTRPGSLKFLEDGIGVDELSKKLLTSQTTCQIVGPHGSGKTSLTIEIAKRLSDKSVRSRWITFRRESWFSSPQSKQEDYLPGQPPSASVDREILFIDGIESLGFFSRYVVLRRLKTKRVQLVLTTHQKLAGYDVLTTLHPKLEMFRKLAKQLHSSTDPTWQAKVDAAFEKSNGDFREAFFLLYDQIEQPES